MKKRKEYAFGKNVYLLGEDKDGVWYWLEHPSWDCYWYWGFGYIETYTNNKSPQISKDINSHQHADDFKKWMFDEECGLNNDKAILKDTPFTESEKRQLIELFKRFYLFKKLAEFYSKGFVSLLIPGNEKDQAKTDYINQKVIPEITSKIIALVNPNK